MPAVNSEILVWARETAGLTLDAAAAKLGIQVARGIDAAERLSALERGDVQPTRPMLLKMAKAYRRPLVTFYLASPPPKGDRGEDFRTLPQKHTNDEPLVDALLRDVRARQSMVRSVIEDDDDAVPLPFVGSMSPAAGVASVAGSIRAAIRFELQEFRAQRTYEGAFNYLRSRIEGVGVFVLLMGNLGSHHTNLDVSAFRGIALADRMAPFIVINDQDAKSAWSFTALHELAHLWLGASGISGAFGDSESALEKFCNDVASELLLPADEFREFRLGGIATLDELSEVITQFADSRKVSRSLVAYRLFRRGDMSRERWAEVAEAFYQDWRDSRDRERERNRGQDGGPDYYVVRRHKLGSALLDLVSRNMSEGLLTPTKAGKVLGVKPRSVAALLSARQQRVA